MSVMQTIPVTLEIGPKRKVFAQALEWPGWCRSGKDEHAALHNLLISAPRYAQVASRAGLSFTIPTSLDQFEIVERVSGTATTDFGALAVPLAADFAPLSEEDIEKFASLLTACWSTFDDTLHNIPVEQRDTKPEKGRSPNTIRLHLIEADFMHLSGFGTSYKQPDPLKMHEQETAVRTQLLAKLRAQPRREAISPLRRSGFTWTPRFIVRRSSWHTLDHVWEIEEKWKLS